MENDLSALPPGEDTQGEVEPSVPFVWPFEANSNCISQGVAVEHINDVLERPAGHSDMQFFVETGANKMFMAMLTGSILDIIKDREDPRAPAEITASAQWPASPTGRMVIEFVMPGINPDRALAYIYSNPQQVLDQLRNSQLVADNASDGLVSGDEVGAGLADEDSVATESSETSREWTNRHFDTPYEDETDLVVDSLHQEELQRMVP